ncbi:non-ribosomal peptide synthetase [Brevibacillus dissolubilis]|uniref:non-ribosomal peptide synthetase n=1 Tax=Brevibacillus dissolubilis TaxID=1844116 RepID=UPI00111713AF|nr:non-ribosomal peptide synthetase [Brevibacillus dissolubilis]
MNHKSILDAYKSGELSISDVETKLRELKQQSLRNPLSEGQKGLWMLQKMTPEMSAYNLPLCFRISNRLDIEKFRSALQFVREQFPILTSVIEEVQGAPVQTIQPAQPLSFQQEDLSALDSSEVLPYLREKAKEPFALEKGPLMRAHLFSRSDQEHYVLITIHHIIFDGVSMMTFIPALFGAYQDLVQGKTPVVSTTPASYKDFVEWEQAMLAGKEGEEHLAYWKQQLGGTLPVLELPTDRPRTSLQQYKGEAYSSQLSSEWSKQVRAFASEQDVNLSVVFLAIFKVLLHRYTGQQDIIVGLPTMGRPEERFESMIGYFINMIAVRSQGVGTQSFASFIRDLQMTVVDGIDHAAYPFPALVRELNVDRTTANAPVFQVAFLYQNFLQANHTQQIQEQYDDLHIEFVDEVRQEGEFELSLEVYEQGDETALNLIYNPELFDSATIERMMGHFIKLTEVLVQDPSQALETYTYLSDEEQQNLLVNWNSTQADYPTGKCIHEFFEEKVQKTPDAVAVVYEEEALTYQQLDERSTQLAIYLQAQGVCPEIPVGIFVERSFEMVIGILGILKAGGAYVPLDPNNPDERLEYMLEASEVSIILTQSRFKERMLRLSKNNASVMTLDQDWAEITKAADKGKTLKREVKPEHLAYVLYTSGSTGKPKGVMVEHRSILNTLFFLEDKYPVTEEDAYLLKTNYVFDVSLSELFGWFIGKGRLIILPPNAEKNPDLFRSYIEKYNVTHLNFVPALLNVFLNGMANNQSFTENCPLKYVMVAGEAFPKELVKKAVAVFQNSSVENIYGPTEVSIYGTWFSCTHEKIVSNQTPIGKPIANAQAYIVDQHLRPVPIGIPGELCIAGKGLARGYYKQPALTAEKFIDNPFEPGTKLYRTGDSVRWLPNGNIEYLGRIDNQVKIRGFRIELGAIESRLDEHPGISENLTVVKEQNGNKKLVAYYTAADTTTTLTQQELRQFVKAGLPEYMVPSHFICLDKMPLTPNGKVDRKLLEQREIVIERTEKLSLPASKVEEKVLHIWQELLSVNEIGMEDGFFDVGGDSLLAVAAADRIKQELSCDFGVTELFEYSNIKAISKYITEQKEKEAAAQAKSSAATSGVGIHSEENSAGHTGANANAGEQQKQTNRSDDLLESLPDYYEDSVAIIGISCHFPGAKNHHEFWNNLKEGKEAVTFFTKEELYDLGVSPELIENPNYIPMRSSIDGKELFDPGFFTISPKDAEYMDPQLRLLLLHSWKAVEDAGYVSKQIPETSVYMSASNNSYRTLLPQDATDDPENPDGYVSWVLAQSGTIPTMISHKLGFKGPSYFVHSNCSSSLVGLYSAYQSIKSGEAKYALVGGTTLHAQSSIGYIHQNGLNFSSDGHVKAFDASADGMAGGEGVAVIMLKKAVDAVKDGDHIYAVLRGIGINNDGSDKVGFYAPSVKGQAEVIQKVLDATSIHPETISYIEAHGTGTKLGDPIEVSALKQVYKQYTDKKQYCGLGSVKTNIGHLDTAAGLAGTIKIALSLYHNELPPTLNYQNPNPVMDLANSPFYVVNESRPLEQRGASHRAALSSFGLGGTNAHAIFEQYPMAKAKLQKLTNNQPSAPYLIPVSAKNNDRLKAYAQELLAFLNTDGLENSNGNCNGDLADLAYTFQVGREAMDSRVIFVTSDIDEWKQQLEDFIAGKEQTEGCFTGEKKQTKGTAPTLAEEDDLAELIPTWIAKGKLSKLAEAWAKGLDIDWEQLYSGVKPQRMSLPTYPFAEERYWPQTQTAPLTKLSQTISNGGNQLSRRTAVTTTLHPMVHQNTSTLSEQRFSTIFTGQEYFIAEHVIKGLTIVPGVVTLEMARTAVEQAIGEFDHNQAVIRLKNVVWVRPIVVEEEPVEIQIGLYAEENGQIYYRMYSEPEAADAEPVLYNQGFAELSLGTDEITLDLESIRRACSQGNMASQEFYAGMIGADYGPGYRGVQTVYTGQGQLLAQLSLPECVANTRDQYILHPSMMDGALQVAEYLQNVTRAALLAGSGEAFHAALPFALQELEVLKPCVPDMWVYVQFSEGNKPGDVIQKVDINLCDTNGTICVRMKGFSTRVMEGDSSNTTASTTSGIGSLMLEPAWREQAVAETAVPAYAERTVILVESCKADAESIQSHIGGAQVLTLDARPATVAERFQAYAGQVFERIQGILNARPQGNALFQVVISTQEEQLLFTGLIGMLKTARLENSKLITQLIEIGSEEDLNNLPAKLQENSLRPADIHIRYESGKRYVFDWSEVTPAATDVEIPWKDNGTYLITGGAGGLGYLFAKEIAQQTKQATLILTGRSTLGADKEAQLQQLRELGANVTYKPTDVTDKDAVRHLIRDIQEDYGQLNGIIHSAGIIKDNYIIKKTQDELQQVTAPKVAGLVHLDEATKNLALDFLILFSSVSGSIGSPGQADYAAANTFMDAYAKYRNELAAGNQRYGKTLSINWPLWKHGGMQVDAETEKMLEQNTGVVAMETKTGIEALYKGMATGKSQVMVLVGKLTALRQKLTQAAAFAEPQPKQATAAADANAAISNTGIDTDSLLEKVKSALKQEISKSIKVKTDDIEDNVELTKYGFDSISMTEFTNKLNRKYKLELTPTIFFEHPTLQEFATHLAGEYQGVFAAQFDVQNKAEASPSAPVQAAEKEEQDAPFFQQKRTSRFAKPIIAQPVAKQDAPAEEPIAIVGISGIFPMARDIEEFWHNLVEGKDCMTEIPKDRWDWREFYGDPAKEANKSSVKWGGFIDGIGDFDPLFFGISPREAEQMDPQQRLLMTYAWKAIEDAGYAAQSLSGTKTGVFIGTGNTGYSSLITKANTPIEGSAASNMSPSAGPNRVSFFLNIHGPSQSIDTACSSSLVAIHQAIAAMQDGDCELAIAGGVNTIILPEVYITFEKAGALSKEGKCKTFSDQADGFAHGEGAGILLLKKLSAAERDGDHIYGVIRSSVVNHGGRATSLTTPNPKAQADLLKTAYLKAGIDPRTITYIEAHGTGTELGDPVEINGLKSAFKELYQHTGDSKVTSSHCGLGSVKTNIGHLSLAAGVAGVIKILLQMKHKTLVKSLHCDTINPYIQLKDSPFYIVQEKQEWNALTDAQGRELPRRAGVSSFGIGGVNAHVVIEEYIPKADYSRTTADITLQNPAIILLSAKNAGRLQEQAQQLLDAIRKQAYTDRDLADVAYTLQVGRDAMDERLAILAGSIKELEEKLHAFVSGDDNIDDCYKGRVNKNSLQGLTVDEEIQEAIEKWMQRKKYTKLLDLWVKGLNVDWNKLYAGNKPKRISLPTYPFVQERYWIEANPANDVSVSGKTSVVPAAVLHPLLHQNTSNLMEQRFTSTYTGEEFFLAEHVVKGQPILPGVAHLELAREAVGQAAGFLLDDHTYIKLKNVVWVRPILIDGQPLRVHIGLDPAEDGDIAFEVYSDTEEADGKPLTYSQGSASLISTATTPMIDLPSLQAQCVPTTFSVSEVYDTYTMIGFDYGPAFRAVTELYTGGGMVLGKLSLPSTILDPSGPYVLHPGMMDSALQASSILVGTGENKLMLPFAIEEIEVYGRCESTMWAYVRYSEGSSATDKVHKRDIDLCDEQGNVCVRMKGLSFRVVEGGGDEPSKTPKNIGTLMLEPVWKAQEVVQDTVVTEYAQHIIMLCEEMNGISQAGIKESIEAQISGAQCILLESAQEGIAERFQACAGQVFEQVQSILNNRPQANILLQVVTSTKGEQHLFTGLSGLLKTAGLENSKLITQLIETDPREDLAGLAAKLAENKQSARDRQIRYVDGKRHIIDWSEVEAPATIDPAHLPWKDQGVYLITGGAGGLGFIFAREIATKAKNPTLILTGRSALSHDKQAQLRELQALGARVEYKQVDVAQKSAVSDLIQTIQADHGTLNAIIHSAGVIRDNYLHKKTLSEVQDVLAPKVQGLVNLDEASQEIALDFFVLFSSIAGTMGSPGQADYAMANAFMDAYAAYRNSLIPTLYRHGLTLSINWPLWKNGGMHVDPETEKLTLQSTGVVSMETETGVQALYKALASGKHKILVMEGVLPTMKQKLLQATPPANPQPVQAIAAPAPVTPQQEQVQAPVASAAQFNTNDLTDKVRAALMQEVSKLLKIRVSDIDVDMEFNQYGFDSITLTEFANNLNDQYKLELTPTIFFEYTTVNTFAEHLAKAHQAVFAARFAVHANVENAVPAAAATAAKAEATEVKQETTISAPRRSSRFVKPAVQQQLTAPQQVTHVAEPVAIVGMSGIFPMARDVEEYWQNLLQGKDCITEIPEDRWDWREYYGDPVHEANKTNVKWGGFIDGVAEFDPLFFGISPREAEQMDPQQRLLMTYAWKAIEDAGYSTQSLSGTNTAVYIGTGNTGYTSLLSKANVDIEGSTAANMSPSVGPNRVSYMFNIHGPSEPIDTACSSALVAIHRAVCDMQDGNCEMAIAGGVNTVVTPEGHIAYDKAGALSKEGKCKTFSDRADGFAVGEGAGILFLKKLSAAERDGDHIYGVIRGTAENHGGRANSLTTPNPKAQAELLKTAYTKAGIDPRTVTYIEAHGTGTALGDPVEINGLKSAFKDLYEKTGDSQVTSTHCGLGSVKTNIGHLALAAGVAGVIKILLQMKHKTLVKSLHCEPMNPYIQLKDSPFYIVTENQEWKAPKDAQGNDLPRRAGVSSFGIGGVNAHIVIEEYIPRQANNATESPATTPQNPAVIVLSAKDGERLKDQAQQLLDAIRTSHYADRDLTDIAYTLQVGRDVMEERLAIIAGSIQDLEEKLQGFVNGQDNLQDVYSGKVKKGSLQKLMADEEIQEAIDKWMQRKKYGKLLDLWVEGLNVDWNKLYGDHKPKRITLPTYPFARERYWVDVHSAKATKANKQAQASKGTVENHAPSVLSSLFTTSVAPAAVLHPLLHQNTSDLTEQRFSSTFTGNEFFLSDHKVKGNPVLPGVAYLEMARAAVSQAVRGLKGSQAKISIKNVVWVQPIIVKDRPAHIHIGLAPQPNGEIGYEVYSGSESDDINTGRTIHSQGSVAISALGDTPVLDLNRLFTQCSQTTLSSSQCYELFQAVGIEYGLSHQGIEQIYVGQGQALAKLSLPVAVAHTIEQFVLHPSLMDSALQATVGLALGSGDDSTSMPFALEEIEVFGRCTAEMWAYVRHSEGRQADSRVQKLDIDVCDAQGNVCVRIKGISSRVLEQGSRGGKGNHTPSVTASVPHEPLAGTLMLAPVWDTVTVEKNRVLPIAGDQVVIVGGNEASIKAVTRHYPKAQVLQLHHHDTIGMIADRLQAVGSIDHIIWIAPSHPAAFLAGDEIIDGQQQGVLQLFRIIKAMLQLGYGNRQVSWTVITEQTQLVHKDDTVHPTHASVHGLIGSMAKEYANWKTRLIDVETNHDWATTDLFTLPADPQGDTWAYRNGEWHKLRLLPVQPNRPTQTRYRHGGVYVVIGGAGGIGEAWSEYVIKSYQAHVVWIGRSAKNEAIQAKLDRLSAFGPAPVYIQADATDYTSMQQAYAQIKQHYPEIHGVIHSAIVLLDQSLANMDEQRFHRVLSAKVDVSVRMAQVFQNEPLDFALFFSSMQSFAKASGQSNYAAGCTFKDAFAYRLAQEWPCAVKVMNWSYWGSVGVVSSPLYQQRMAQAGIGSIEPPEAAEALEQLLGGPLDQLAMMKTTALPSIEAEGLTESIEVYPESTGSTIQKLRNYNLGDRTKIEQLI